MRKMKKLVSYLILLISQLPLLLGLFVFNGSGYRLSEQDAADIAYKNAGVKTSEISQSTVSKARSGLHGSYELVSQRQTTILSIRLTVSQDLF